jgi:hypothetical protein
LTAATGRPRGRPRTSTLADQVLALKTDYRTHREVADVLGISELTSRAYYSRRRRELEVLSAQPAHPRRPEIEGAI